MSNLPAIRQELFNEKVLNRLAVALGESPESVTKNQSVMKYPASVLAEIERTIGDDKKDLSICTPQSIAQAMIDSARFRLMIDGTQKAHLVKYGRNAQFQVGYRGYLAKIAEHYSDVDFTVEPIYAGDKFTISETDGFQSYSLDRASAFNDDLSKLVGVFCAISYTKAGKRFQKITTLSANEIEKIKSKAKQKFIWDEWYIEKAKAAAIKRACKIHFAGIQGLQEIIKHDNERGFNLEKRTEIGEPSQGGNVLENLNAKLHEGATVIDAETGEVDEEPQTVQADIFPGDLPMPQEN